MHPQFGYTPPAPNAAPEPKKAIPAGLIPDDALHTGDGWIWQRLADGSVQVRVLNPSAGNVQAATVLTPDEYAQVQDLIDPRRVVERAQFAAIEAGFKELAAQQPAASADEVIASVPQE